MNINAKNEYETSGAYARLADAVAVQARKFVVIAGAGLSSPNIPGWGKLRDLLVEELERQYDAGGDNSNEIWKCYEFVKSKNDIWAQFREIKRVIPTEYRNIIRSEMNPSLDGSIPEIYSKLWDLPIAGMISLNIDKFANRSFRAKFSDQETKYFVGRNAGHLRRHLGTKYRFLYELHGSLDDTSSWIFTDEELQSLYKETGYLDLLKSIYSGYHILFVGISADDIAIGGPLRRMGEDGIELPEHFWITDRDDQDAIEWAEKSGVERVHYTSGEHGKVIDIIISLTKAVATELTAPPVKLELVGSSSEIPSVEELIAQTDLQYTRTSLNKYANYLLSERSEHEYEQFLEKYDRVIDMAWYIPINPSGHQLFQYTLEESPKTGAFGSVYRARDDRGNQVALKLLKRDIRRNIKLMHSFRRGISAMKILEDHKTKGMVAQKASSEIPTFVTMEWIEGPTLEEAREAHLVEAWLDILNISLQVSTIVFEAHLLPERVLHRDLRPANIMLRDGWDPLTPWNVVVLDFDLSTHLHAKNESVLAEASPQGYLAPEQFVTRNKASSRNALVDSFGLGMTIYYLVSGEDPEAMQHRTPGFKERVENSCRSIEKSPFVSTGRRVARIILNSTRDEQTERMSMDVIKWELSRLIAVNNDPESLQNLDSDLVAEEIACRCDILEGKYDWTEGGGAKYDVSSGPSVTISRRGDRYVTLSVMWADNGNQERRKLGKYLSHRVESAVSELVNAGWDVNDKKSGRGTVYIEAEYPISQNTPFDSLANGLNEAIEKLILD